MNRLPRTRAEWAAWAKEGEEQSPWRFRICVLALAAVLMVAHYTLDELAYRPEHSLWTARAFWSSAWIHAAVPFVTWLLWRLVSAGRVKTLKPICVMAVVLCAGSALAYCVPVMFRSVESLHLHRFDPSVEKWHWSTFRFYWQCWTPAVLVVGNLVLLRRWRKMASIPHPAGPELSTPNRRSAILKAVAITSATAACGITALHLILPRVSANGDVVDLARTFLVQAHLRKDFDYLLQNSFAAGRPLAPLLTHLELADLQRRQYYPKLDDTTFQAYVLSPKIAPLPLDEVNWRRTLWEHFHPRIRRETDPVQAAKILVRVLRERVGIDPSYDYRVGVETIWTEQMTDEAGFERIYVAALRSVGIAARLNDGGQAELLEGNQWQAAPRVLISSFEEKEFPVPRGGLVNFRN